MSPHKGVQRCGIHCQHRGLPVAVKVGFRGRAFYEGVHHCHSVWECPVCAQGIALGRADELRRVLRHHSATGGGDYLLTLTLPHDQGDRLKPMRQLTAKAWSKVVSGAPWRKLAGRLRILGWIRGAEVTVGPHGWHAHLHVVVLTHRKLTRAEARELTAFAYARWLKAVTAAGYRAPSRAHGVDLQHCRVAQYVAKLGLADELARPGFKRGRAGHRTPFQLLDDIRRAQGANAADVALWEEYASDMRGAKQLTWSRAKAPGGKAVSLYKLFGVALADDAQLALEPGAAESASTVYEIERDEWDRAIAHNLALRVRILELAEAHPPNEAGERIRDAIDQAQGLEPVPFTIGALGEAAA